MLKTRLTYKGVDYTHLLALALLGSALEEGIIDGEDDIETEEFDYVTKKLAENGYIVHVKDRKYQLTVKGEQYMQSIPKAIDI